MDSSATVFPAPPAFQDDQPWIPAEDHTCCRRLVPLAPARWARWVYRWLLDLRPVEPRQAEFNDLLPAMWGWYAFRVRTKDRRGRRLKDPLCDDEDLEWQLLLAGDLARLNSRLGCQDPTHRHQTPDPRERVGT
ncbi:hypothetical protein N0V88_005573 [Collariella sp. IMI 366227]|nr:hypothetical protein N0V88_005573 [Collariella sp. IMI 366227]